MIIDKNGNKHVEIGDKYGKLTVIEKSKEDYTNQLNGQYIPKHKYIRYICKCECGNIVSVIEHSLTSGHTKSCHHCNEVHIGDKFNRLTIIDRANDYISPNTKRHSKKWKCQCECGNIVEVKENDLKTGSTKSCGCLNRELIKTRNVTHGLSNTKLYIEYASMIRRCYNHNNIRYSNYGGIGITVCNEWYNPNYEGGKFDPKCITNFCNWALSHGYRDDLTIDRINVNGNYEPNNCRWIPKEHQAHNRRNSIKINLNGEIYDIGQISSILGINYMLLYHRLKGNNWDLSSLFTYITDQYGNTRPYILDKYNNPIPINIIYFIDEYGFPISQDKIDELNI